MVFASRIIFSTRFFSVSVSFTRMLFSEALAFAGADTSNVLDLIPIIFDANAEGSSSVPKRLFASTRSACLTFWKSRNLSEGIRQINQYR